MSKSPGSDSSGLNRSPDQPTVIPSQRDSSINESIKDTLIGGPVVSSPDGATQLGVSTDSDSFEDYEVSVPVSAALRLEQLGDYKITGVLGKGGMGIVYRAHHLTLKRDVAIKMMLSGANATAEQAQRFLTEARAVAHLQHPNIVQIFEVGQHQGMPYFTLELVNGQSLSHQLNNRTLSEREAATLMHTLCTTLRYAHDQGILHRDLKPANVLMTADGQPKVTDFGLARRVEDDGEESSKTQVGTIMGTPSYMSPEQARGDVHLLTPATDQYSLGAMLYEMLTGRPPFIGARPVDTVLQVIHQEPTAPRELQPKLSVDLETICMKALQKDVAKRYASCEAMADDLGRFLRGEPILARPVSRLERLRRWCRRNPVVASLSALAVTALVAVAVISTWSAMSLSSKNAELTQRTERLQDFVQTMYGELREFNVDEAPRVKPARDRMLNSFNDIMLQVVDELPREGQAEAVYAAVKMGLVDSLIDQQKTEEAEAILSELQTIYERRLILKQGSDAARNNLVLLFGKIGNLKRDLRRDLPASLKAHQRAFEIANDILQYPKAADDGKGRLRRYEASVLAADAHTNLGATWYRLGDPHKALSHLEKSLTLREDAIREFDEDSDVAEWPPEEKAMERGYLEEDLHFKRLATAAALFRSGRTEDAEPLLKQTLEASRAAMEADPGNPRLRHDVLGQAGLLAEFLGFTGRGAEALTVLEDTTQYVEPLLSDDPAGVAFRRTVSVSLYRLSQWRAEMKQGDAAVPLEQCLTLRRKLAEAEPSNDRRQLDLMLVLARSGLASEAQPLIDKYRTFSNPDTELLVEIARALSQLSIYATTDSERDRLITEATTTLDQAKTLGFQDTVYLSGEPDFAPLRSQTGFQTLLKQHPPL
ncbi:MAG: protein kinase [Planctomyces sp.]|nr:protein kinase [Planctomyces sp.]